MTDTMLTYIRSSRKPKTSLHSILFWVGWKGGTPAVLFQTQKYIWKYSDVWRRGINPLIHYLAHGQAEGRAAIPVEGSRQEITPQLTENEWLERVRSHFDPTFYEQTCPSARKSSDLFEHYVRSGWVSGYDPNPQFSVNRYLAKHPDVREAGMEPLAHFIRHGIHEGRTVYPSERVAPVQDDEAAVLRAEFDDQFYRSSYPELATVDDPFTHYMTIGWKEGKNPSRNFDTSFYLRNETDIRESGINPFKHYVFHGKREGRRAVRRIPRREDQMVFPKVSVIVPNYNHSEFLLERLRGIEAQHYPDLELIILDDCSSDNSRDIIRMWASSYQGAIRLAFNEVNSGNVFSQWERGLSLATGDLIWICESDDTCDGQFLEEIVYFFQDPSVRLVFGDIQFIDHDGRIVEGMTDLRESAEPGIWKDNNLMPAAKWFTGPLAIRNLISNVGGAVFRKPRLSPEVWKTAKTFSVAGDWYLYLMIAAGGQIAYAPKAKAYFRQHANNTSVAAFDDPEFYTELGRLHALLRARWAVPQETTFRFFAAMTGVFEASRLAGNGEIFDLVSLEHLLKVKRQSRHVAVSFLNFNVGGGEIFPIELANALKQKGFIMSAVVQHLESDNDFVRNWLDPDIPVYSSDLYPASGAYLALDASFDIVHSHNIWSEFYFLTDEVANERLRYIATLHGSYEVSDVQRHQITRFFDRVTWVYLADRNLEKFHEFGLDTSGFHLIPNGVSRRLSPDPVSRSDLGISDTAFVFLFAARSHPDKGWRQAASAFDQLTKRTPQEIVLVMAGEGSETDFVRQEYGHNPAIKLLGFRRDIDDLIELADCMLLPTRFSGESMPLTLIQSIIGSVPIITTDVGQIRDMLRGETGPVGVAIEPSRDEEAFVAALLGQMQRAVNGELGWAAENFATMASRFSFPLCVDKYIELYDGRPGRPGRNYAPFGPHAALPTIPDALGDGVEGNGRALAVLSPA